MIYCVRYSDVVAHLDGLGFEDVGGTEAFRAFEHADGRRLTLRPPNVNGDIPEIILNDAFDTAGLIPPEWDVFWCD